MYLVTNLKPLSHNQILLQPNHHTFDDDDDDDDDDNQFALHNILQNFFKTNW